MYVVDYTCLFLYLTLLWGILAQLNEFLLMVGLSGECHTSYHVHV